jgi:hypothetical protein
MKKALLAAALILGAPSALSAEYGIGLSAKSDDALVYVPINVSPKFRIEPSLRYHSIKSESEVDDEASILFPTSQTMRSELEQIEVSVGWFRLSAVNESVRLYYGLRTGYIDGKTESNSRAIFEPDFTLRSSSERTFDGYRISPTLGLEYLFGEHFSIGGEVQWSYQRIEGSTQSENVDRFGEVTEGLRESYEQTDQGTDTHLIVRYRF